MRATLIAIAALTATPALAQTAGQVTLYELPFFAGRSVTVTTATPDLNSVGFARRAQSARVSGSWQVCPDVKYAGTCQTLTSDQKALALFGLGGNIVSLRTSAEAAAPTTSTATTTGTTATTSTGTATTAGPVKVDLSALDAGKGTVGQDTAFFARPTLGQLEIAAGSNDKTTADTFCKQAGYSSAAYASRARVQVSNLVDLTAATKGNRSFPLRDVLCAR
ncbi:beta/gamma crystallin-related protein [Sphingomonas sp. ID0503]|uniref:beta/gamma crystallin-related protein n=1 Tax=Sphingomonas sp. ID0503 TaxID=3399691 RepID=UPI003AFAC6D9